MHSFLLIGQSNMAGRGFLTEAKEIDTTHIKIMRNGLWNRMFRPINPDRSFSGVSLAESFAESYANKYDTDVGLICCADGGTSLEQWMPGTILYDNAVNCARLAQRSSEIVGILWHQGEGDIGNKGYLTYQARFEVMIQKLREDLNLPDVPVLVGGLGDFLQFRTSTETDMMQYLKVNEALKGCAESIKNCGFVSAEGLTSNPDNLHFNAAALYDFGLRYFEAYEKITDGKVLAKTGTTAERSALEQL